MNDLDLAKAAVATALAEGCSAADAIVVDAQGTSVRVRDAELENVEESRSRGVGVRAFRGRRVGIAYANDLTSGGVRKAAKRAAELANIAAEDEAAGLPDPDELGILTDDLATFDASLRERSADDWRDLALACERAATADERITLSEGARSGSVLSRIALANSDGFVGERAKTYCSVGASVFATGEQGERQRAGWSEVSVFGETLAAPEEVGAEAARRAIRQCGWKRPPSGPVPVVFAPEIARDFAHTLASAVSAAGVYRKSTFLADRLGEEIAVAGLSLIDDPTLVGRPGSRPFDAEGVRSRRTVLIDGGRLATWMADSYSARRVGGRTTGAGARALSSNVNPSSSNLVLAAGDTPAEDIVGGVANGLYVTQLFGFGVNLNTGAWSRGGQGLWIDGGRISHAVQEFTVAGDLSDMLRNVSAIGDDLTWHGSSAAPTLRIDGLTVAAG